MMKAVLGFASSNLVRAYLIAPLRIGPLFSLSLLFQYKASDAFVFNMDTKPAAPMVYTIDPVGVIIFRSDVLSDLFDVPHCILAC